MDVEKRTEDAEVMEINHEARETKQLPTRLTPAKKDQVIASKKVDHGNASGKSMSLNFDSEPTNNGSGQS